jgi:type III restriction enzyme
MPKKAPAEQLSLIDVGDYLKTAPCVPLLRQKVGAWREEGYPGATDVTKHLLTWWFANDHRLADGRPFAYHRAQRDAIETLIYTCEVARVRSRRELYERFARSDEPFALPVEAAFARFATKMATGARGHSRVPPDKRSTLIKALGGALRAAARRAGSPAGRARRRPGSRRWRQ